MIETRSGDRPHDLVMVGGGFRGVTFLGCASELLQFDVVVFEESDQFGPGSFANCVVDSSSAGQAFFRNVNKEGLLRDFFLRPEVQDVVNATLPVPLERVASALARLGQEIQDRIGKEHVRTCTRVTSIDLSSDPTAPIIVSTDDGCRCLAKTCVLATGREERPWDALSPWREQVWLSADVIHMVRLPQLREIVARSSPENPIVVVGGAHSAFSVLLVLARLLRELHPLGDIEAGCVKLVYRNAIRLMYQSIYEMNDDPLSRSMDFEPERDICRETGIIYRDSGIRHSSARLYREIVEGKCRWVEMIRSDSMDGYRGLLDVATAIVQAIGYRGRVPSLKVDGQALSDAERDKTLQTDEVGRVVLRGVARRRLFALRVEPTPRHLRDYSSYGSKLYQVVSAEVRTVLRRVRKNS